MQRVLSPTSMAAIGLAVIAAWLGNGMLADAQTSYASADTVLQHTRSGYQVSFANKDELTVPASNVFAAGNLWALVSKAAPLPDDAPAPRLAALRVPHGDMAKPMSVDIRLQQPLAQLFATADTAGLELAISSAYRSVSDQQALLSEIEQTLGPVGAAAIVAKPGTSEHHTGLAVDFSDDTPACRQDSDDCSLGSSTAAWLAEYAPNYGFILRYPASSQATTGYSAESWHYRYVGKPLAVAVAGNDLTLEEAMHVLRPGKK